MVGCARSFAGRAAVAGAVLLLAGCATPNSPSGGSTAGSATAVPASASISVSVVGPTDPLTVEPVPVTPGSAILSGSLTVLPEPPGTSVPDWPTLLAEVERADALLPTAEAEGWWAGPACNPDVELHRDNAGQDPLSDEELRAECAANLAEFWASQQAYQRFQALDETARAAELARVAGVLGLAAGQDPTIGQLVVVQGCEQGWVTEPARCSEITGG